jgi:hypothetical protein
LDLGLHWIRRRQHALARAVLGLFCAAWLQAAVVPCVMASVPEGLAPQHEVAAHVVAGHAMPADGVALSDHAGHGPAGGTGSDSADAPLHCPYCPPGAHGGDGGSCDRHGSCAYPHDPQVDARSAIALHAALPVTYLLPSPMIVLVSSDAVLMAPEVVPRVSLPVSYCRFIE